MVRPEELAYQEAVKVTLDELFDEWQLSNKGKSITGAQFESLECKAKNFVFEQFSAASSASREALAALRR